MKLFGTALLFLVLFSLCCVGAEETTTPTPIARTSTAAAAPTVAAPTTPSNGQNVSRSSANESSPKPTAGSSSVAPNTTNHRGDTLESTTSTNSTVQQTLAPTSVSRSTSNGTAITGMVDSPTQISVASPSSLTQATAGQNDKATARNPGTQKSTAVTQQEMAENDTKNASQEIKNDTSYTGIILPVIIALIVITFTVFLLMAMYRMCFKTGPERQENGTEQSISPNRAPSDKENVKLISVKTTSPEIGEQSSQGKNKTRQHDDSSSHLANKRV